jgi:hypothetical protein
MAKVIKSLNAKATVAKKATGKQHGGNGTAKVQTGIKAKPSGKVNTPPKGAIPSKKMGGMLKSKKSC